MLDKNILNEKEYVEEPFLRHLERLGWRIFRNGEEENLGSSLPLVAEKSSVYKIKSKNNSLIFRENFNQVILEQELRDSLLKINPWLEEDQISDIVREISVPQKNTLLEANQEILEKILENTSAENRKIGERSETVKFLDFKEPDKNSFIAISQFKVSIPGTENHIIPDIVLFINGLPLVVVECKSSSIANPIGEAIEQLFRYQNRRGVNTEGNERIFWYNQLVIATCRQVAKYSTITGDFEHFLEWKDPYPSKLSDIDTEESQSVSSQQVLVQGMLRKENLLNIIQSFILFQTNSKGRKIKVVPRYQQYRAVSKIIDRLQSADTPQEKGGIVWHTQGSGKSLTMMFIVRKMYREERLSGYKVVFITDRTDLEKQLRDTAKSLDYTVKVASKISSLKKYLQTDTPDIVMGMIHKFQEHELSQKFPVLNLSDKILVMIDEAHRSQYKILGANLEESLPNAVKIAFTGTPIEKTESTFGDYIDRYSIRQAVEDGVTVEIVYEGRTHRGEVLDAQSMNQKFEDVFQSIDDETRKKILNRYTWKAYLEAQETIRDKARDMISHYIAHIFTNKFKAQVVVVSRIAAIRYKKALEEALQEKILELRKNPQPNLDMKQLEKMRIEVVISGSANDEPEIKKYTDEKKQELFIRSFKLPFDQEEKGITGDVGILVVQSMLLTGFDAPVEQVMYLDDVIREHNLLQAIARVNRVENHKTCGFIVDYVGIANHLREALSVFENKDIDEIFQVFKDASKDIDDLQFASRSLHGFFKKNGVENISDIDASIDALVDEDVRNEFLFLLKKLNKAMDRVLPKKEALNFVDDLKMFYFIAESARHRYRDGKLNIRDASQKIRSIVEEYLISKGVDPKIPPLSIFSQEFAQRVKKEKSPKARSEELKYAIKEHILVHKEEDPEFYERLGEKLEKLLKEYEDNWEKLAEALETLRKEANLGRSKEENYGFNPETEMPFLGLLKREIFGVENPSDLDASQKDLLIETTRDILELIKREIQLVDFWNNLSAQKKLRGYISSHLLRKFIGNKAVFKSRDTLSQKILELAFHLRNKLSNEKN